MVEDPRTSHHYTGFCLVVHDFRQLQETRPKFKIYMLRWDVVTRKDDRHDCWDEQHLDNEPIDCIIPTNHHHQYTQNLCRLLF